eukprot:TRINITY_DN1487_c3_g1_i1.p1 TRINITY_DN1487_c3_g1~~TRINITY_DN1487_c3_g1_i1.p1  ORF type:complete len:140 (+),score=69.43 TRINITY_DN1487_c3_g1_i1:356-775(+)
MMLINLENLLHNVNDISKNQESSSSSSTTTTTTSPLEITSTHNTSTVAGGTIEQKETLPTPTPTPSTTTTSTTQTSTATTTSNEGSSSSGLNSTSFKKLNDFEMNELRQSRKEKLRSIWDIFQKIYDEITTTTTSQENE